MSRARGLLWPLLPDAAASEFLRACLSEGEVAAAAFERWCSRIGDPDGVLRGDINDRHRALLPLLERALRDVDSCRLDARLRTTLRASAVHEGARSDNFVRVYCDVAQVLAGAGIESLAVAGLGLSHTVWPDRRLRHDATITLLVAPGQFDAARTQLILRGCVQKGPDLQHPAGPPIRLRESDSIGPGIDAWSDAAILTIGTLKARTLSVEIAVLERCQHALLAGSAPSLNWVCDLWYLSARCDARGWSRIGQLAIDSRMLLVAAEVLGYLGELGAAVPGTLVRDLRDAAARLAPAEIEAALYATSRTGGAGAWAWLSGCESWTHRVQLLRYGAARRARALRAGLRLDSRSPRNAR